MKHKLVVLLRIFLPLLLGGLISLIIKDKMNFEGITKPMFSPPEIAFPIVWSILYLLMGISYYLYKKTGDDDSISLLYYLQLIVNLIWPILFFNFRLFFFSILWIILLIVLVILYFKKLLSNGFGLSAYLLIPYIIWLFIAFYLNTDVFLLN